MAFDFEDGTAIYRTVDSKEFEARIFKDVKGDMRIEVDTSKQPVEWGKHPLTFQSVTQWAIICARVAFGDTRRHAVNGWKVCYMKTKEDKRVALCQLRDKAQSVVKEEEAEMPKAKPLPKEPVPFEKSVMKNFPVIKKMFQESEKQPDTLETDSEKIWKEVIEGKERWVCDSGFVFEVAPDGDVGQFIGKK